MYSISNPAGEWQENGRILQSVRSSFNNWMLGFCFVGSWYELLLKCFPTTNAFILVLERFLCIFPFEKGLLNALNLTVNKLVSADFLDCSPES